CLTERAAWRVADSVLNIGCVLAGQEVDLISAAHRGFADTEPRHLPRKSDRRPKIIVIVWYGRNFRILGVWSDELHLRQQVWIICSSGSGTDWRRLQPAIEVSAGD